MTDSNALTKITASAERGLKTGEKYLPETTSVATAKNPSY